MKWISVKDRLPKVERGTATQVIVNSFVKGAPNENIVIFAVWYNGNFYNGEFWQTVDLSEIDTIEIKTINYWMPLPSSPSARTS